MYIKNTYTQTTLYIYKNTSTFNNISKIPGVPLAGGKKSGDQGGRGQIIKRVIKILKRAVL